VAGDIMNTS